MTRLDPLGSYVVIEPIPEPETTQGGILLPDKARKKTNRGRVLAAGPGKPNDMGVRVPLLVKPGDIVLYSIYGGTEIKLDGRDLLMLEETGLLAIVRE